MALSGSRDYSLDRDTLIERAMKKLGLLDRGETPTSDEYADGAAALNELIKYLPTEGVDLYLRKRYTLFLVDNQESYSLGTSTTDHFTDSYVTTALAADVASGASTITVDSITGISDGDYIGITKDSGGLFWTTVNGAPSGSTITLTSTIDGAASDDARVYAYTSKAYKPFKLLYVNRVSNSDISVDCEIISLEEYQELSQKDSAGAPNSVHYEPKRIDGDLYVWPTQPSDSEYDRLDIWAIAYPDDVDASTDDIDFPQEATLMLIYGLAWLMAPEYGVPAQVYGTMRNTFLRTLDSFLSSNDDEGTFRLQQEIRNTGDRTLSNG